MKRFCSILIISIFVLTNCKAQDMKIDKSVVNNLDLDRYLGTWYEIARYDHSFERNLVGVTAEYSIRDDGKIMVVNSGFKGSLDGEKSVAVGKAKIPDENQSARLKVSFFWFFYADYWVLELDKDYQWAVIGSKSDKYLWILSRTPQMEPGVYDLLLEKLSSRGYDTEKLLLVDQPAG